MGHHRQRATHAPLMAALMARASVTVVPVRPGPFDLRAAGATLEMARALKAPIRLRHQRGATDHP